MEPKENDLTFVVHTHNDLHLLVPCLAMLRESYPSSRVVVVADGDGSKAHQYICHKFNTSFVSGRRLFLNSAGAMFWDRMLRIFLQVPTRFMVKIDTDTKIWRKFKWMPDEDRVVCGTINYTSPEKIENIQGGCKIVTCAAAKEILDSGFLLDNCYTDPAEYTSSTRMQKRIRDRGWGCEDRYSQHVLQRLSIPILHHPEVLSLWQSASKLYELMVRGKELINNEDRRYAATHPHKFSFVDEFRRSMHGSS